MKNEGYSPTATAPLEQYYYCYHYYYNNSTITVTSTTATAVFSTKTYYISYLCTITPIYVLFTTQRICSTIYSSHS